MHPIRQAVRSAPTKEEVLERLSSFLQYLHAAQIDCVLPASIQGLRARDAADVRHSLQQLDQETRHADSLTMAGDIWLEDVRDAFAGALERLESLESAGIGQHSAGQHRSA